MPFLIDTSLSMSDGSLLEHRLWSNIEQHQEASPCKIQKSSTFVQAHQSTCNSGKGRKTIKRDFLAIEVERWKEKEGMNQNRYRSIIISHKIPLTMMVSTVALLAEQVHRSITKRHKVPLSMIVCSTAKCWQSKYAYIRN